MNNKICRYEICSSSKKSITFIFKDYKYLLKSSIVFTKLSIIFTKRAFLMKKIACFGLFGLPYFLLSVFLEGFRRREDYRNLSSNR